MNKLLQVSVASSLYFLLFSCSNNGIDLETVRKSGNSLMTSISENREEVSNILATEKELSRVIEKTIEPGIESVQMVKSKTRLRTLESINKIAHEVFKEIHEQKLIVLTEAEEASNSKPSSIKTQSDHEKILVIDFNELKNVNKPATVHLMKIRKPLEYFIDKIKQDYSENADFQNDIKKLLALSNDLEDKGDETELACLLTLATCENDFSVVVNSLIKKVARTFREDYFRVDRIIPIALGPDEVKFGEEYKVEVLMGTISNCQIESDAKFEIEDGRFFHTGKANKKGVIVVKGSLSILKKSGSRKTELFQKEIRVID